MNFNDLLDATAKRWPFNNEKYPGIDKLSGRERRVFVVKHVLLHQIKACGELAAVVEPCDHGEVLHGVRAAEVVKKMFANILRLAEIIGVGIDEFDLLEQFPRFLMQIGEGRHYLPLWQAGVAYDSGFVQVSICGDVLERDGQVRPITEAERRAIAQAAEEYSAGK